MKSLATGIFIIILMGIVVIPAQTVIASSSTTVNLEKTTDDLGASEETLSTLKSPAQARRIENLAFQLATTENELLADLIADVEEKAALYESARTTYMELKKDPNTLPEDLLLAEEAMQAAHEFLQDAKTAARDLLAEVSATTVEEITVMREEGMGWGQIAHELGLHPSVLGLGHHKGPNSIDLLAGEQNQNSLNKNQTSAQGKQMKNRIRELNRSRKAAKFSTKLGGGAEIAAATERDVKTGWSKGHGNRGRSENSISGVSSNTNDSESISNKGGNSSKSDISGKGNSNNNKGGNSSKGNSANAKEKNKGQNK